MFVPICEHTLIFMVSNSDHKCHIEFHFVIKSTVYQLAIRIIVTNLNIQNIVCLLGNSYPPVEPEMQVCINIIP